jgi:type I restriction enzyme R subunit
VNKRNLIEPLFTMLHPEGIRGIFNQKEIDEILTG